MNRLVERVSGPTIWIVNDIDRLGPEVVRRMNLVMRFPKPSLAVRKRMIPRISNHAEFRLNATETATLARLPAAPALIENAIRSAARIGGSGKEAQQILEYRLQAMGSRKSAAVPTLLAFDPTLSSADVNLRELAERVRAAPTKGSNEILSSRFAAVRSRPASRDWKFSTPHPLEWLLIEWPEGEKEPTKYWLSTLPEDIPFDVLVDTAKLRWRIERDYEELKSELGLAHFEGRSWRGFHHHAVLCIAAYGFLIRERPAMERCAKPPGEAPAPASWRKQGYARRRGAYAMAGGLVRSRVWAAAVRRQAARR